MSKKGFTLIEILVAVAIFASVVTIASTIFVSAIRAQRQSLAYQQLLDQTSYVMEYMSRAIRMAIKDDIESGGVTRDCLTGSKVNYEFIDQCLKFRNYKNECQYFCLDGTKLVTATTTPSAVPVFTDLTSPNLRVTPLDGEPEWIKLSGEEQTDTDQPLVTILLQIEGKEQSKIQIQTSISQRNLDVER